MLASLHAQIPAFFIGVCVCVVYMCGEVCVWSVASLHAQIPAFTGVCVCCGMRTVCFQAFKAER